MFFTVNGKLSDNEELIYELLVKPSINEFYNRNSEKIKRVSFMQSINRPDIHEYSIEYLQSKYDEMTNWTPGKEVTINVNACFLPLIAPFDSPNIPDLNYYISLEIVDFGGLYNLNTDELNVENTKILDLFDSRTVLNIREAHKKAINYIHERIEEIKKEQMQKSIKKEIEDTLDEIKEPKRSELKEKFKQLLGL